LKHSQKFVRDGFNTTYQNRLRWTWRYDTPEKYQIALKGYYRMISGIDREIAKIREELRRRELINYRHHFDGGIMVILG